MSGTKVIAAMAAAIVATFALAGAGFLLFEPEAAPCVSGDLAANRYVVDRFEPRIESFDTVRESGAFICHRVPTLDAEGWTLTSTSAERSVALEFLVRGYGVGIVYQDYVREATGDTVSLWSSPHSAGPGYFVETMPPNATSSDVVVRGLPGKDYRFGINPDLAHVHWLDSGMEHMAVAQLGETFTVDDLIALMDDFD